MIGSGQCLDSNGDDYSYFFKDNSDVEKIKRNCEVLKHCVGFGFGLGKMEEEKGFNAALMMSQYDGVNYIKNHLAGKFSGKGTGPIEGVNKDKWSDSQCYRKISTNFMILTSSPPPNKM